MPVTSSFAICPLAAVAVRVRPDHGAAQLTQLLFGERVSVLQHNGKGWSKVRCVPGTATGWVMADQLAPTADEVPDFAYSLEMLHVAVGDTVQRIPFGGLLPHYDGLRFRMGQRAYSFNGQAVAPDLLDPYAELVAKLALRFVGAPYLSGGRTVLGIDETGLWQLIFRLVGIELPRRLDALVRRGSDVGFVQRAAPGDLCFFTGTHSKLIKVGMLLDDGRLLHVRDRVRVDAWQPHGWTLPDGGHGSTYTLRTVRRLLPDLPRYRRGSGPRRGRGGKQFELF